MNIRQLFSKGYFFSNSAEFKFFILWLLFFTAIFLVSIIIRYITFTKFKQNQVLKPVLIQIFWVSFIFGILGIFFTLFRFETILFLGVRFWNYLFLLIIFLYVFYLCFIFYFKLPPKLKEFNEKIRKEKWFTRKKRK